MNNEISKLLEIIIKDGCLPEFDYYYDENTGKDFWTCSFYRQGSFTIGVDRKTTIEDDDLLNLLKKVDREL